MLILTRKKGQSFYVNDNVKITVKDMGNDTVRIAIDAPRDVKILREELMEAVEMNEAAAEQKTVGIEDIRRAFSLEKNNR